LVYAKKGILVPEPIGLKIRILMCNKEVSDHGCGFF